MTVLPVFSAAMPEMFLLGMVLIMMLIDAFFKNAKRFALYFLTQCSLMISFIMSVSQFHMMGALITFNGQFVLDPLACVLKCVLYVLAFVIFWYSRGYNQHAKIHSAEFYFLTLLSLLGGMVLISANTLLVVYLGLELLSLPLYALIAISRRRAEGSEAAMKYFVMGAIASGLLLYGMSLIYGLSGTLNLSQIALLSPDQIQMSRVFLLGVVLVIIAIAFKLGAVPFHLWAPDVYEGAPTSVTIYVSTVPKIAAFGMLTRLVLLGLPHWNLDWQWIFNLLGVISLLGGNLMALVQHNIKRLLAYSTIANIGFILISLGMGREAGAQSALFYLIIYVISTVGVFGILLLMSRAGLDAEAFDDFQGLNKRNPWIAFMLALLMLSTAGIPPLAGFDAKFLIITQLINLGHWSLGIFALVMSVIGSAYYLRILKAMYFEEPERTTAIKLSWDLKGLVSLNGLVVLFLGIFPSVLLLLTSNLI